MRHSQLRAFHHVALLGGFSRAAEALFLTQPAVSEQVRKLEQAHDVLLFHRDRKRVSLTSAGEDLFRMTRQYFETEQQIEDYLSAARTALHGELRILADSAHHITAVLSAFRTRFPKVTVTLQSGNTEDILEDLRAYKAEIGVVGSVNPGQDMTTLELGASPIIAFAAKGFLPGRTASLGFAALKDLPLIFREARSKTRQKLEEASKHQGIALVPAIVAEGREAVREVVASGAGIGFVSEAEFAEDARLQRYELADAVIPMSETMLHLTQRRVVRVIRNFMDIAREVLS